MQQLQSVALLGRKIAAWLRQQFFTLINLFRGAPNLPAGPETIRMLREVDQAQKMVTPERRIA